MSSSASPITRHRLIEGIILILGMGIAVALLKLFMEQNLLVSGLVVTVLFTAAWAVFSKDMWWLLVPITVCLGGILYVGFRINAYELGVLIALLASLPTMAMRRSIPGRKYAIPFVLVALAGYVTARMMVDLYWGKMDGYQLGNIFRVYAMGLWPLVFAIPFILVGSTRYLKVAFWAIYVVSFLRSTLGVVGYLFPRVLSGSGIQVILPGVYSEGIELRASALWLLYAALCAWSFSRRRVPLFHMLMVLFAIACRFMGGSRGSLGVMLAIILIWMCVERRFVALGVFMAVVAGGIIALNVDYDLINMFSQRMQRTLSIVMVRSPFQDVHRMIEGSDEWHRQLGIIAFSRWTDSPERFLFGHRLIPFMVGTESVETPFYDLVKMAADLGYYEAGLWTVLAVTGIIGGILYGCTLWKLSKPLWGWVWRGGIRNPATAFGFIALCATFLWVVFGWIVGHFPSEQIMFLLIARVAYEDQRTVVDRVDVT